jgi:hypothetical protein
MLLFVDNDEDGGGEGEGVVSLIIVQLPCSVLNRFRASLTCTGGPIGMVSSFRFRISGSPHPHFAHFLSMCCSHIRCQITSSSAIFFHELLTWAAWHSDLASKYCNIFIDTSGGHRVIKSTLSTLDSSDESSKS